MPPMSGGFVPNTVYESPFTQKPDQREVVTKEFQAGNKEISSFLAMGIGPELRRNIDQSIGNAGKETAIPVEALPGHLNMKDVLKEYKDKSPEEASRLNRGVVDGYESGVNNHVPIARLIGAGVLTLEGGSADKSLQNLMYILRTAETDLNNGTIPADFGRLDGIDKTIANTLRNGIASNDPSSKMLAAFMFSVPKSLGDMLASRGNRRDINHSTIHHGYPTLVTTIEIAKALAAQVPAFAGIDKKNLNRSIEEAILKSVSPGDGSGSTDLANLYKTAAMSSILASAIKQNGFGKK